nr:hypothetical protein [Tanacetum cinerariifolium]
LRRSDNENTLSLTNLILRAILTDLQETLKRRWRYLIPAESHIHNHMLIPDYQDNKYQDFRYSDELSNLGSHFRVLILHSFSCVIMRLQILHSVLEQICANFEKKNKVWDQTAQALSSRIFMLENHDLYSKIDKYINENVKEAVQDALQAPVHERFRELSELKMKEILCDRMFKSGSYRSQPEHTTLYDTLEASMDCENMEEFMDATTKSCKRRCDDQDPLPPPPKDTNQPWKTTDTKDAPSSSSKQKPNSQSEQPIDDIPILDDMHLSDSEDTDADHLPKIKTKPGYLKPIPEEETPKTPKPYWFLWKIRDMVSVIKWYYKRIGKLKLTKANLEDKIDLTNPEGNRVVSDVSKPLPLAGPLGQVNIQPQCFFNKDLKYLISCDNDRRHALSISKLKAAYDQVFRLEELVPSLWIERERYYNVSVAYGISHWWFKHKEFYITRHCAPSDRREVRSHIKSLSVISVKTFSRYSYTFLREIVLRIADYKGYKISEADFKILHPNDFEDLYLLHLQGNLNHLSGVDKVHQFNPVNLWIRNLVIKKRVEDLQLRIKSYQTKLNLTQPNWDASYFLFKEYYTIVHKPRAIIYKDRNDQKKMMRENEVHKFSDGTLIRILEKLDHMVKNFRMFKFNPSMENRIWSEDDKRSKEFIEAIERRLKIMRIFRNLENFVSGRLRDVDYRLIQRAE